MEERDRQKLPGGNSYDHDEKTNQSDIKSRDGDSRCADRAGMDRTGSAGALPPSSKAGTPLPHIRSSELYGPLSEGAMAHLRTCRYCREELAEHVETHELLTAPANLKSSILDRSRCLDVQLIAGSNHASKKLQFFFFGLKVGTAVLCSLALLTMAPSVTGKIAERAMHNDYRAETQSDRPLMYYEIVNDFTARLDRISSKTMEVFDYDKKKR